VAVCYNARQDSTVQYNTAEHTIQYNTAEHTIQYNNTHHTTYITQGKPQYLKLQTKSRTHIIHY